MSRVIVSIVLCVYNEEERLSECLESLFNQNTDKDDFEIIIIDDQSVDDTYKIIMDFISVYSSRCNVRYYKIKHGGLSTARNTGIEKSLGKLIAFIDGDAKADNNWLKSIISGFCQEDVFAVSGKIENLNTESPFAEFIHKAHFMPSSNVGKSHLVGANMAFRREFFLLAGGFINDFTYRGDETCLLAKFLQSNPNKVEKYSPDAIVFNEHAPNLKTWLSWQYQEGRGGQVIHKLFGKTDLYTLIKPIIRLGYVTFIPHLVFYTRTDFIVIHLMFFLLRIYGRRSYLRCCYLNVVKYYSKFHGLKAIIIVLLGTFVADVANILEWIFPNKKMKLVSSSGEIIETVV